MVGIVVLVGLTCAFWILIFVGGAASRIAWFGFPLTLPIVAVVILIWTSVTMMLRRKATRRQITTILVALLSIYPATWVFGGFPLAYPAHPGRSRPALAVRVPFDGPVRVLWGGDHLHENHHVTQPEERWAYDLGIEPIPDELRDPRPTLEAYGCWDASILAPAAGRVYSVHDAEPDKPPGTPLRRRPNAAGNSAGNYVDIEVSSTGTHLLLFHMKEGSVRFVTGQQIAEGDTVGKCGSSGNSTLPHLHIHHQRNPWVRESEWRLGEGLPLHFRDHVGDENPRGGGAEDSTGYWRWTGSVLEHTGQ